MTTIEINNRQQRLPVDTARLTDAVRRVLAESQLDDASEVSIAVVDDAEIHELNRRYLDHDWPTDVLSFVIDASAGRLEGEIIVSAETARRQASRFGWRPEDELLLYVVHGALHLVGYDDRTEADRDGIRAAEQRHLRQWGLTPRYDGPRRAPSSIGASAEGGSQA